MTSATDVQDDPENETRSKLIESLDIEGSDSWVQFTSDEPLKK